MTDQPIEVEIKVTNAANESAIVHAEYRTTAATPQEAAGELAETLTDVFKPERFKAVNENA